MLHEDVIVVKGRLVLVQDDSEIQRPENCKIVMGSTGEKVCFKWGKLYHLIISYINIIELCDKFCTNCIHMMIFVIAN